MTTLDGCIDDRSYHYVFLCFRCPPAPQKRENRPNSPLLFCGAGEERNRRWPFCQRARRRAEERNTLNFSPLLMLPTPSSSQKKTAILRSFFVELEGVEPSSKQVTDVLSTCLFPDCFSSRLWTRKPKADLSP